MDVKTAQADPFRELLKSAVADVTPTRLRLLLVIDFLALMVFCSVAVSTIKQHEHSARTVGYNAAPSVMAAQEIKVSLDEMDASLANQLLQGGDARMHSEDFERARIAACKSLIAAAKNITYGRSEQTPIENIMFALGKYEAQARSALDAAAANNKPAAIQAYLSSVDTLETKLLPSTQELQKANTDQLESIYSAEKSKSALSCGLVLAIGIVLTGCLIVTQLYFTSRFRRRINVPLLIATIAVLFAVNELYSSLRENAQHMKVAKEDSYDSLVALMDARASAYHANALQSRWLFDRERVDLYDKKFRDAMTSIANFSDGQNFASTIADVEKHMAAKEKITLRGFSGSLATEFGNIRFEGESEAALEALQALAQYSSVDETMRKLGQAGDLAGALKIGLGYAPGESNYYFARFDEAAQRAIKINKQYFETGLSNAFQELNGLIVITAVVTALIVGCIYFGFRPRLAEYVR